MNQLKRINHEQLGDLLDNGAIWFYHKKCNGDIKKTFATRAKKRIPDKALPIPIHIGCTIYYDIFIGQYRSCSKKLEIWVDSKETL